MEIELMLKIICNVGRQQDFVLARQYGIHTYLLVELGKLFAHHDLSIYLDGQYLQLVLELEERRVIYSICLLLIY